MCVYEITCQVDSGCYSRAIMSYYGPHSRPIMFITNADWLLMGHWTDLCHVSRRGSVFVTVLGRTKKLSWPHEAAFWQALCM